MSDLSLRASMEALHVAACRPGGGATELSEWSEGHGRADRALATRYARELRLRGHEVTAVGMAATLSEDFLAVPS